MSEEKAKLLRSLTIDRSAPEPERPSGRRWWSVAAGVVVGCAIVAFAAYVLTGRDAQEPS